MSPSRKFFSKARTVLSDPPEWATVWIFGGTYVGRRRDCLRLYAGRRSSIPRRCLCACHPRGSATLAHLLGPHARAAGGRSRARDDIVLGLSGGARLARRPTISRLNRCRCSNRSHVSNFVVL